MVVSRTGRRPAVTPGEALATGRRLEREVERLDRRAAAASRPTMRGAALSLAALACLGSADTITEDGLILRLAPKEKRCVYEELEARQSASLEVFVLSGGNLDVSVAIDGPFPVVEESGLPRSAHRRGESGLSKPHSAHLVESKQSGAAFAAPHVIEIAADAAVGGGGIYRICLDNAASRISEKLVTLSVTKAGGAAGDGEPVRKKREAEAKPGKNSESIEKIEKRVVSLRSQIAVLKDKQTRERRRLAHHKSLYDAKHNTMVEGSLFETVVYIVCSIFQIVFVRRWFSGKGIIPVYHGGDHSA